MTDERTDKDTKAIAAFVGRAAAEAVRREDFAAFRAWVERELPDGLPGLESEARNQEGLRAGTNAVATSVWNASPLPSNGYRPRPLPPPGRNDPCPCGSGRKFKRCCGRVAPAWPSLPEEDMWGVLVPHLTKGELRRFASDPALPAGPLGLVALEMKDRGQARAARTALARRLELVEDLDARDEPVLEVFVDLESEARDVEDFIPWASALADRLPRPLDAVAYRYLVAAALSVRRSDAARLFLDRVRQSSPDDPALGSLEVMTLLAAGELARASERARFWLANLRRRGLDEEMPDAIERLEEAAPDPEHAARELREAGAPFLGELAELVEKAAVRPVRPYVLSPADGDAVFDRPPADGLLMLPSQPRQRGLGLVRQRSSDAPHPLVRPSRQDLPLLVLLVPQPGDREGQERQGASLVGHHLHHLLDEIVLFEGHASATRRLHQRPAQGVLRGRPQRRQVLEHRPQHLVVAATEQEVVAQG